ncbi:MAG: hypothetical protein EAY70_09090 [Sphingomonadales bacterium]|nr:MAG: hypothetical protein EAY70_09090 [Sphingomonadales bacterium]
MVLAELPAAPSGEQRADGTLVIDLTQLVPPPPPERCTDEQPDPLNPEIVVCKNSGPSPRLGPMVGPVDDGFASAIPRARIKLSETASAEANATAPSVGGFNAQGGEVRLKIDF